LNKDIHNHIDSAFLDDMSPQHSRKQTTPCCCVVFLQRSPLYSYALLLWTGCRSGF